MDKSQTCEAKPVYDKLESLKPGREETLHRDLAERTGIKVTTVKVSKIDLQRGTASISMQYHLPPDSIETGPTRFGFVEKGWIIKDPQEQLRQARLNYLG